jgi:hypothetical protein
MTNIRRFISLDGGGGKTLNGTPVHRKSKGKGAASSLTLRFDPDAPPVHLDEAPGDDKAQTRAFALRSERRLEPHEGLEQLRLIFRPDPDARILHGDFYEIAV